MCLKATDYKFKPQAVIASSQSCMKLHVVFKLMFPYSLDYVTILISKFLQKQNLTAWVI